MDLVLCVHLSKGRGYFLKNAGNRNSKVGKWSLNLAVCTQEQGQALWAGIHHVRQGERRAWADSSHPNLLLRLLSRFKTHPCHLYCDILLHLLTFLGFHNTLQGRLGKLIWDGNHLRAGIFHHVQQCEQRRRRPFPNLEHKDSIWNSSLIPTRFKLESQRAGKSSCREEMAPRWRGGESADNWAKEESQRQEGKMQPRESESGIQFGSPRGNEHNSARRTGSKGLEFYRYQEPLRPRS